jgi:hypothetical protein
MVGPPGEVVQVDPAEGLEHPHGFGGDFLADAVAGDDRYARRHPLPASLHHDETKFTKATKPECT